VKPLSLPKFSIGVGDRFTLQAEAQLRACMLAADQGADVIPVWNKSNREHTIIGSDPSSTRAAADQAVKKMHWKKPYFVDADHIGLATVDRFLQPCDFFTIDVADWIGRPAESEAVQAFIRRHTEMVGALEIQGLDRAVRTHSRTVAATAGKYLAAIQEAGRIYRHIEERKDGDAFIAEVSMDETDSPQTPMELLVILAAIADERIPIQTIAPKFTGRFNKGVDYVGNLDTFCQEFRENIAIIAYAIGRYGLPGNLKLSVHSGSDKFSIYEPMRAAMKEFDAGVHLKTAGTTWLEELIGLAEAGGDGLELTKEIYAQAFSHQDELCAPYAAVIDIKPTGLPAPEQVKTWSSDQFAAALRHDPKCSAYNSSMRQLLHVAFKIAAQMGERYLLLLRANEETVGKNVTENLFERHIRPLFLETET
jgi:tagaturonate epimerase